MNFVIDELNAILQEREQQYGSASENFAVIAELWSLYLSKCDLRSEPLADVDVAYMLMLMKLGRALTGGVAADTALDLSGYAVLAAGITKENQTWNH